MAKKKLKKTSKHPNVTKIPTTANHQVDDVLAAALIAGPPPVLMKLCRLCETKDGPFLNIFDAEKVIAKKIEELMPFALAENDDLPHKICFRCSAKVEELHEFIQKCIRTQENLRSAMGKHGQIAMKSRTRVLWEQQLNKTQLSNDDICDVLIKRAMQGIPSNYAQLDVDDEKLLTKKPNDEPPAVVKKEKNSDSESDDDEDDDDHDDDDGDVSLKQVKLSIEKADEETIKRSLRSNPNPDSVLEGLKPFAKNKKMKTYVRTSLTKPVAPVETKASKPQKNKTDVESKKETIVEKPKEVQLPEPKETVPPFNIMDHVCTIKVNKVGTLFQCKLCNRNFLKKEIVMNHGCAKNHGPPKETNPSNVLTPGPPKPPTVQYIKMDKNFKKPMLNSPIDKLVETTIEAQPTKPIITEPEVKPKPKPKVGPASRIKPRPEPPKEPTLAPKPTLPEVPSIPPSVSFPTAPSLNSRYKLVQGPNNTFQLVEDTSVRDEKKAPEPRILNETLQSKGKKRRTNDQNTSQIKDQIPGEKSSSPEVIDLDDNESHKPEPYPVGLFQPVPHHSSVNPPLPPVPFTTPAMKKQSYTIVQTGNPSKLLISTKPQPAEEPLKKKTKKRIEEKVKEPFKVTSEQMAPVKDSGFFTFVTLDPLLQPSYVLPTDNIIQESQITTSTSAKSSVDKDIDKYPCNMCGESFSREKKLLSHIQSHYNQMDKEDELRTAKPGPKRRKKNV